MIDGVSAGSALLAGLLGSGHCALMCGGLAASLRMAPPQPASGMARSLRLQAGRIGAYVLAGALAGGFGQGLVSLTDPAHSMLQIRPPTGPLSSVRLRLVTGQVTLHALDLGYQNPPDVLVDMFSKADRTYR